MHINKSLKHVTGLGYVLTLALMILGGNYSASAMDSANRALVYQSWKNAYYFVGSDGRAYFRSKEGVGTVMSFWQFAEAIEVSEDAAAIGLESAANISLLCRGFTNSFGINWSGNSFNDDLMWASIAFSRAYQLTGDTTWRTLGKNGFDVAYNRGHDAADGGIFQTTGNTNPKCTCGNGSGADAAYLLYVTLGDVSYKTKAQGINTWMVNYVYAPATGAVMEGPGTGNYFTYDSGCFATINAWLADATKANKSVDWVQSHWGRAMQSFGPGSDGGGMNGIGLRGMARTRYNLQFSQSVVDNAWGCRNSRGLTSCDWNGRTGDEAQYAFDTCSSPAGAMCVPLMYFTSAVYKPVDNSNAGRDVTSLVNNTYYNNIAGAIGMPVNNSSMGGDPAVGHVKQLVTTCTIGGYLETFTVPENGGLYIMNGTCTIVSATYLPVDGSNAGTNVISRFSGGVRNVLINNTTMGGDPAPGHAKQLKMVYSEGGNQATVVVLENSALNL